MTVQTVLIFIICLVLPILVTILCTLTNRRAQQLRVSSQKLQLQAQGVMLESMVRQAGIWGPPPKPPACLLPEWERLADDPNADIEAVIEARLVAEGLVDPKPVQRETPVMDCDECEYTMDIRLEREQPMARWQVPQPPQPKQVTT